MVLAKEVVEVVLPKSDDAITIEHLQVAKENLIRRKDAHLDSLAKILRKRSAQEIIRAVQAGKSLAEYAHDDRQDLINLGILNRRLGGGLVIASPIYAELASL